MKKIGIVLGILLILVFLVAVLAPFMIDLNQYKGTILSKIKPYVPREVDFEHIELTVLSGFGAELRGLRIADNPAFPTGDFLQLEGLQVRVMLLPLLKRQIEVKRIILKRPVIRLARNADGESSFSDLIVESEEETPEGQTPAEEATAGGLGLLAGFLVSEFSIQQGRIVYQDELLRPGQSPLVIDALDVDVRDLALDRPVSIRVAADLLNGSGQNFEFAGTVGPVGEEVRPETVPFDVRASLRQLPLGTVVSLLPLELPVRIRSGTGSVSWEAKGSFDQKIVSRAAVDLQDLRLEATVGSEPVALHCTIAENFVLEAAAEKLVLESLEVTVNGDRLLMKGVLESFRTDPRWEGKIWSEGFRPDLLVAIVPAAAQALPGELSFEGPLAMHLESAGTREAFALEARLDLEGMKIEYQDLFQKASGGKFSIGCEVDKKGERVTVKDLEVLLHTLALNASGELTLSEMPHFGFLIETNPIVLEGWDALCPSLAPYEPEGAFFLRSSLRGTPEDVSANLQISSDKIGFLLPPPEGEKGSGGDRSGLLESCNIKIQAKKKPEGVLGSAQAEIKKGQVMNVPFEKLMGSMKFSPDLLEISGVEMKVFQGEVQAKGRYDPTKGTWSFTPNVRDVAMGEVLDRLTEYKDSFSGSFRGQFSASGSTRTGAESAVNAEGSFRISEGELKNFDIVGSVTDALFGLEGVDQKLKSSRQQVREHESTRFDWLEGTFKMRENVLFLEGLQLRNIGTSKATDSDALLEGKVHLQEQLLDMKGKVILAKRHSEELAQRAEVMKALYNAEQRVVLPIALKGETKKPVVLLDTEYVLGAISRYYTRQGVEKLREQLGLPAEKPEGEEKPGERLLRELFKKR
jgi:uncharacterized protein involved in outer membrane biogenesis